MTNLSRQAFQAIKNAQGFEVSFEVFPAGNDVSRSKLTKVAEQLAAVNPRFVSVTYGAGGAERDKTFATLDAFAKATNHALAGHLTCAQASRAQTDSVARRFHQMGINHIVALRGDGAEVGAPFAPHEKGYENAADLVAGLKQTGDFEISVAAYPELHPNSTDRTADLANLKAKFDAGADRALTQFFFDNRHYLDFVDEARAAGIDGPIVPGIMLITNFSKLQNFAKRCGASIPDWLIARFEGLENDPVAHELVATSVATEQVLELASHGGREFHFYTMNTSRIALAVCHALGLGAKRTLRSVA